VADRLGLSSYQSRDTTGISAVRSTLKPQVR
jgi:hypothetical protein